MFYFSRGEQVALALLLVALVAAAGAMWWAGARASTPREPFFVEAPSAPINQQALVHVCGAVRRPGVYAMPPGARVCDALKRAGGATQTADTTAVNLAAEVQDGQQLYLPARAASPAAAAAAPSSAPSSPTAVAATPVTTAPTKAASPSPPPKLRPGQKISLNHADAKQFERLPGIGPAYATRIVEYRKRLKAETGQGFTRVEQLLEIPGIGPRRFADVKDYVTL